MSAGRTREKPKLHKLYLQTMAPLDVLSAQERGLHSRIQEIERELREAPEREQRRRSEKRITIPPLESRANPRSHSKTGNVRRLTKLELRALARERWRHAILSTTLVLLFVGLLTWLARILQS
jgi:hypothetical protein